MNLFKLLEEKTNVKFTGKTGEDLMKYLEKNFHSFNTDFRDLDTHWECLSLDPSTFYLEVSSEHAMLFENEFSYECCIGENGKTFSSIKEMLDKGLEMVMIECLISGQSDCQSFNDVFEKVKRISKEHNIDIMMSTNCFDGDCDTYAKFVNGKCDSKPVIKVRTENDDYLFNSYYWIADRAYKGLLEDYLKFPINII